jgi:hypothetical protein
MSTEEHESLKLLGKRLDPRQGRVRPRLRGRVRYFGAARRGKPDKFDFASSSAPAREAAQYRQVTNR